MEPAASIAVDLRFLARSALVLLLYVPIASTLETWSRPFLRELAEGREPVVDVRLRFFWLAFLTARVLSFGAMRSGLEPWVLVACAVAGVVVLGNLAGVNQLSTGGTGFVVLGLCFGPLLPGILGLLHSIPLHSGLILGSALGAATLWQLLVDPALTTMVKSCSPRQRMRGSMLAALGLCATLLLVALMQPEPVTSLRPVHETAKKQTLRDVMRGVMQKIFVRHKT